MPTDEVVARCLLYRLNLARRRPYSTAANLARCKELLRYPVSELKEILGSHGFVAKTPDKTRIVSRILRAERHEPKRAQKAFQRRMEALERNDKPSKYGTDIYSSDEDKEDDDDDSSSDESFGWTEDESRYLEIGIPEGDDGEGEEVEVEADDDDDNDDDNEEGEELSTPQPPSPRAARPTTAGKAPVALAPSHKRARTQDDEADDEIDPPSPKRLRASSSAASSRSDSDDEDVDHEFAEDPLASLFTDTSTGMLKRKRDEDVISVSDGEDRSPKRVHSGSGSEASSTSTTSSSMIAKQARCDMLKPKSPSKAPSPNESHAPVAEGIARKKPIVSEEVTSSGVTYNPVTEGIARLKPIAREEVTSSGITFIPVAEGIARLAPMYAKPALDTNDDESSNLDAPSIDARVEEPGEDEGDEHGYEGEDESDEAQDDEQDWNEEFEGEEYGDSSGSHPQSLVQSPEEVSSLPNPATKKSESHDPRTAGKKPFITMDSNGIAVDSLKRKRAEKLEDSRSDSDEPLISKRRTINPLKNITPNNGASTSHRSAQQARDTIQSSNRTLSQILQQQSHQMIIDGVDTRVFFENKKVPPSILNATLRIMMGCAEENDVADVYQCRKNLPGYRAYLEGRMRAAADDDNDWLKAQKAYELREMDAMIVSIGDRFDGARTEKLM